MKFIFLFLAFLLGVPAFANEATIRTFVVDWRHDSDRDVQMCDDSYSSHVRVFVPYPHVQSEVEREFKRCKLEMESISTEIYRGKNYRSYLATGYWDCQLKIRNAKTNKVYAIDLGDGC